MINQLPHMQGIFRSYGASSRVDSRGYNIWLLTEPDALPLPPFSLFVPQPLWLN
jgi:hypothetical protein